MKMLMRVCIIGLFLGSFDSLKTSFALLVKCLWFFVVVSILQFFIVNFTFVGGLNNTIVNLVVPHTHWFTFGGKLLFRAQSFFWEPGAWAVFLNFYILFELYENNNKRKGVIAGFTMLFTYSTYGIVMALGLITLYFIRKKYIIFIVPIGLVVGGALWGFLWNNLEEKFTGEKVESSMLRTYDFIMAFNLIKENPLSGIGANNEYYISWQETQELSKISNFLVTNIWDRGNSNSFLMFFARFGIPIGLLYIYCFYKQNIFKRKFLFLFLFLISMLSQPLLLTTFFMLFPISYLVSFSNKRIILELTNE
ncbi:MAG: O-antigen ligase family protein [Bacteroidales bacterium]|nr:O-antigen ligase family protein [Bacteroidales bacterium]